MGNIFNLSIDLQILVVCGAISYKIISATNNQQIKTEEFLIIIFVFGFLSKFISSSIIEISKKISMYFELYLFQKESIHLYVITSILTSIALSIIWLKFSDKYLIILSKKFNLHNDDFQESVYRSIRNSKNDWKFIYLHLKDGRIFSANFDKIPANVPLARITLNDDGIALYVTEIIPKRGKTKSFKVEQSENGYVIDYIPMSQIDRIEIGWKKP
jgi:hypothetical protein